MDCVPTDGAMELAGPVRSDPTHGGEREGVAPPPAAGDAEMIERQWRIVEALAQGLVDTYGPEYRL